MCAPSTDVLSLPLHSLPSRPLGVIAEIQGSIRTKMANYARLIKEAGKYVEER